MDVGLYNLWYYKICTGFLLANLFFHALFEGSVYECSPHTIHDRFVRLV